MEKSLVLLFFIFASMTKVIAQFVFIDISSNRLYQMSVSFQESIPTTATLNNTSENLTATVENTILYHPLLLGIIGALLLIILIISYSFKQQLRKAKANRVLLRKQNEELVKTLVSKEEKETLLKEIHHRVKNNLQIINSLIRLQSEYIDKNNFQQKLEQIENRIRSMALIHEKLYQSENLSRLKVGEYIEELSQNILSTYTHRKDVNFSFNIDDSQFTIDTLIPLGLILNESISNALKHAFNDQPKTPEIKISVNQNTMGETIVKIEDNGSGSEMSLEELKEESLGMDLIYSLTDQLDGLLRLDTHHGFKYTFVFPSK